MSNYGNYVLTREQINALVAQGTVFDDLAQGDITNAFNRLDDSLNPAGGPAPFKSTLRGRNTPVRTLWAKVLIHFNNYLRGNPGNVDFDVDLGSGPSSNLSYQGSEYMEIRDLEIYERDENNNNIPALRYPGAPSLIDRGEQILDSYYNKWNDARTNAGIFQDAYATGREVFGQPRRRAEGLPMRPVMGPALNSETGFSKAYFGEPIYASQIEQFIDATLLVTNGGGRFKLYPSDNTDWYIYAVWSRLVALHTSLYGHNVGTGYGRTPIFVNAFDTDPGPTGDPITAAKLFVNVVRGVSVLWDQRNVQASLAQEALAAAEAAALEEALEEAADVGFTVISMPQSLKGQILTNSNNAANKFFTNTFNSELIAMVPLLYNFYLTSEYFPGIDEAFENPKDRVLDIIISTIANDNNFDSTPDLSRPAADSAVASATGQDQQAAFNSAARDFILKMIIKTPIDILKGVVELVDPHVAITKVIKTGSGFAFNQAIGALDQVIQTSDLNETIADATGNVIQPNLNGEDLLTLLLCIVDYGLKQGVTEAIDTLDGIEGNGLPPIPENFFPRVSVDGIDFTGTVSGMLMMPPSPLGLIYLLLELLKNDVTNQTENISNANTESANAVECTPEPQNLLPEPCDDTE